MNINKLIPCIDCGHQISTRALACPGCGRRVEFGWIIFAVIWGGLFVLSFLGAIAYGLIYVMSMR